MLTSILLGGTMKLQNQSGLASVRGPVAAFGRNLLSMTALSAIVAVGSVVIPTGTRAAETPPQRSEEHTSELQSH